MAIIGLNKEQRIKYLGFDDAWFFGIGVIVVAFITDFLFSNSFAKYSLPAAFLNWTISLLFGLANWSILRFNMIFLRKKFPAFEDSKKRILLNLGLLIIVIFTVNAIGNTILYAVFGGSYNPVLKSVLIVPVVLISVMVLAIYEAIYYYIRLQKAIREEEQAKQVLSQARLEALRNQIQPHFFFNSLNTLRDIIDQSSKEEAKQFLDKLSNVYRFILEAGNANIIPLKEEIDFAKSYMYIQSERFGENLKVNWQIPKESEQPLIVSTSLQLLLENAIKHNVISRSKPLTIDVTSNAKSIIVENIKQSKSSQFPSTKMGLKNITKRYELLTSVSPIIEDNAETFRVTLPLLSAKDLKN